MKKIILLRDFFIKNSYFYFVYLPLLFFISIITMLLLCFPEAATTGVGKGIDMCLKTLIPSMFPFMVISSFCIDLKLFDVLSYKLTKLTEYVFHLPGVALPIIILSFVGGYPVGAFLTEKAFEQGKINRKDSKRMLLFCVNPGPAFTISFIGSVLYGCSKIGIILYASSLLTSLLIGVLSRYLSDEYDTAKSIEASTEKPKISESIISSINSSIYAIVNICTWVIIFSCLGALVDVLAFNDEVSVFVKMISEVTNGVALSAGCFSLPVTGALVGFSGFCVHMQLMPVLIKLRMKYKYFLCARIISSGLNCVITAALIELFPESIETISFGIKPDIVITPASYSLCIFMMLMSVIFVVGDSCITLKKTKG